MKLTVLVDNNTLIDRYFLGEPGLSFLIEDSGKRVLFDAGYSGVFLENARRMELTLHDLDSVVLSHGHLDHAWGLSALMAHLAERACEGLPISRPEFTAHPHALDPKRVPDVPRIGLTLSRDALSGFFDLRLTREPYMLTENLAFLGEIPRKFAFEPVSHRAERLTENGPVKDDLLDDTGLCARTKDGLLVITGCAHAGVCNTVEHAREVMGEERVSAVIGGFHLLDASKERLAAVAAYLGALKLQALYPCHCVDLVAKIALAQTCPVGEAGSGLSLSFA